MPPRKHRSYTAEYKVEAAHRVINSGRMISEVAREPGIDAGMLSVRVKDERRRITAAEVHGDIPPEAAERTELQRLRRQVTELEKDNDFSGKSVGVLCRDAEKLLRPRQTCAMATV
jgi:transposase